MKQRVQWRLYVDESGSFSTTGDPGGTVVLAGVLLRERDGTQLSTQLRALTHRYFPGLPTPLHAAHLFAPAFHLLHRTSLPTVGRMSGLVDGLARTVGPVALRELDAAAEGHDLPPFAVLEAWQRSWLRRDVALVRSVWALREQVELRVHQLLSGIASSYGADGCALLGVVHELGEDGPSGGQLYGQLFAALAERVLTLRRQRPQEEEELFVLAEARGGLTREDLMRAVSAAESFPLLTPGHLPDPDLRMHALAPQSKEGQDPGIVLADLAASMLRKHARGFGAWATVAAWAPTVIGLPVQAQPAGLPAGPLPTLTTLSSSDWLKEALWAHRDVPMHRPPGWSGEQAQRWLSAAKANPGEVAA